MNTPDLQGILDPNFGADLASLDTDHVRELRNRCRRIETGLSYLRRLAQGRLDIVAAEVRRRQDGRGREELDALIDRLPAVLAERNRRVGNGRLPDPLDTGELDAGLSDELDDIAPPGVFSDPVHLDLDTLSRTLDELTAYERRVSDQRRVLFERLDRLEAELVRRYRSGEATVDGLLH